MRRLRRLQQPSLTSPWPDRVRWAGQEREGTPAISNGKIQNQMTRSEVATLPSCPIFCPQCRLARQVKLYNNEYQQLGLGHHPACTSSMEHPSGDLRPFQLPSGHNVGHLSQTQAQPSGYRVKECHITDNYLEGFIVSSEGDVRNIM